MQRATRQHPRFCRRSTPGPQWLLVKLLHAFMMECPWKSPPEEGCKTCFERHRQALAILAGLEKLANAARVLLQHPMWLPRVVPSHVSRLGKLATTQLRG